MWSVRAGVWLGLVVAACGGASGSGAGARAGAPPPSTAEPSTAEPSGSGAAPTGTQTPEPTSGPSAPSALGSDGASSAEIVAAPTFELHEWGVVDVPFSGPVEIAAGAGAPSRPMAVRKPVVYVHLLDGVTETSFSVRVGLGGSFVEHDPPGTLAGNVLEWPSITARATHCAPHVPTGPCGAPDGVCEVAELARYDAPSAACLDVGGVQSSLLFYRGQAASVSLPLSATRAADGSVTATASATFYGTPGGLVRLSSGMDPSWPAGRVVVSRVEAPGYGGSVTIPVGTETITRADGIAELTRAIVALGLTDDEAAAFTAAWADELFGPDPSGARDAPLRGRAAPVLGPRLPDVLLYFLPYPTLDTISSLDATPWPRAFHRAMLVRVDLGPV